MRIRRLNHVSLVVADTRRALDFYAGVLGLQECDDRPETGFPGSWLDLGAGQQIHLLEVPVTVAGHDTTVPGGRDNHLALEVDDLDDCVGKLRAANIDFAKSRSGRRALFCRDPDGHAVELVEVVE